MVPDEDIGAVLAGAAPPQAKAQRLIDLANGDGGRDNVSVVFMRGGETSKKSGVIAKSWTK